MYFLFPTRSLTKMWVSHSLEQGDIGRILEPLLLLLLHPSTARVSHYYSEREKTKSEAFSRRAAESQELGKAGEDESEDGEEILDEECGGHKADNEDGELNDSRMSQETESTECARSLDSTEEIKSGSSKSGTRQFSSSSEFDIATGSFTLVTKLSKSVAG